MVDWGPLAHKEPKNRCACFIAGSPSETCLHVSRAVGECGIEPRMCFTAVALREALSDQLPDIVFLEVVSSPFDAVEIVRILGECHYKGKVQIIDDSASKRLDAILLLGRRYKLDMLPCLLKPVPADSIKRILFNAGATTVVRMQGFLSEALRAGWIEFWYQPKIDLRSRSIVGAEALCRIQHPQIGLMLPRKFLPSANPFEQIKLAELAIATALYDITAFSAFNRNFRIAINVPAKALCSLSVPQLLMSSSDPSDVRLTFEITEADLVGDLPAFNDAVARLERHRIALAIDNFGSGANSFARLQTRGFSEVKIDRQFVAGCAVDKVHMDLCGLIIEIAHRADMTVVAEGVEDIADLQMLCKLGCDVGQGYLFARPMPVDELLAALHDGCEHMARYGPYFGGKMSAGGKVVSFGEQGQSSDPELPHKLDINT